MPRNPDTLSTDLSRRSLLVGAGACVAAGAVGVRPASARSTDEWQRLWELPAERPQGAPAALDETVFVPSASAVRAVNAETGDADWVTTLGDPIARDGLQADGDRCYAGTESGTVACVAAADGETVWSTSVGGPVEGLKVSGRWVVVQTPGAVSCLAVTDGAENWRVPVESGGGTDGGVRPVTDGQTVLGSGGASVVAVDLESGETRWTERRDTGDGVRSLAVHEGSVVVGGTATTVALTLESGESLWTRELRADQLNAATGSVYAMGQEGTVALDPVSGRTELSLDVRSVSGGGLSSGEVEPHGTSLTLSGERDGVPTLLVVAPETGEALWTLTAEEAGAGFGRAVLADERLVVQDYDRELTVAYGEPSDEAGAPGATETAVPGGSGPGTDGTSSGSTGRGLGIDTIVGIVGLLVAIVGALVGLAQLREERKKQ